MILLELLQICEDHENTLLEESNTSDFKKAANHAKENGDIEKYYYWLVQWRNEIKVKHLSKQHDVGIGSDQVYRKHQERARKASIDLSKAIEKYEQNAGKQFDKSKLSNSPQALESARRYANSIHRDKIH